VVVEHLDPEVDGGRFPVKRVVGERVDVAADVHADGHDVLGAVLRWRRRSEADWIEVPMAPLGNDRWAAGFTVEALEPHLFAVEAWVDDLATWRRGLEKKLGAGVAAEVDLLVGAALLEAAAARARGAEARRLRDAAASLRDPQEGLAARATRALTPAVLEAASRHPDRSHAARSEREVLVAVEPPLARFSAWYELFPRSLGAAEGRHGTLRDVVARLDDVAAMGFDVLYLPPIHPIGRTARKGPNNTPVAGPGDPGSPWAIGAAEGGHTAVHPELGTVADLRDLAAAARSRGLELALDVAFQCAPDHPWVTEHPQWFRHLPDGTIQTAENPPKKYEDIYPLDFESEDWRGLWEALRGVVLFWVEQGVRVFRVDNPHTKPYAFWEWLLAELRSVRPDLIFLSEAFTRPRVMERLAKLGFSQSYTYFTWRNTRAELTEYLRQLTTTGVRDFLRPNFWPNTPDILPEYLQAGGRAAFQARLVLAATLSASYGIYGPAFELCDAAPRAPGTEEYLDSEKYQLRRWEVGRPDSLRHLAAALNRIRREHQALQRNDGLRFHEVDNDQLIAYSKATEDAADVVLVVVNLDPHHRHAGWLTLPLERLGLDPGRPFQVHDLVSGARYLWSGARNYVELDPAAFPAHVFRVRRRLRTEQDFDYFL
jgi:starch synthase (maltosyl-transferring)